MNVLLYWDSINYSLPKATSDFEKLKVDSISEIEVKPEYTELRNNLLELRDNLYDEFLLDEAPSLGYFFDIQFGMGLYKLLNGKYKFTLRDASNDDIWRYLTIKIIPDVAFSRWNLNEDRFFKSSRRMWLKTIWWYIHLSWNIDEQTTLESIKNHTTDTVMNLVERPGVGYNVELYRAIMKKYAEVEDRSRMLFRRVLILNTARLETISPELIDGGIKQYIEDLFESV